MIHLHKRLHLNQGDVVVVNCSHQSNILLMTDANYNKYKTGQGFQHHAGGGFFKQLPARFITPFSGYWNVTIDLGGGSASIRHSISVIPA